MAAEKMHSTTFIMIAATLGAMLVWVFCEYTMEAVRRLRVLAKEEDEQRNQQTIDS